MLKTLESIVLKAGETLKEGFYAKKDVTLKGEIDLVTQYDVKVEEILKKAVDEKPEKNLWSDSETSDRAFYQTGG